MDELTKVKILLMQEVKDSKLPKGGKVLLLGLVTENEDLDQTCEILEAFEVIDEKIKEKIKKWGKKAKPYLVGAGLGAAAVLSHPRVKVMTKEKKQ